MQKIEPAVTSMFFSMPLNDGTTGEPGSEVPVPIAKYIDISQCASIVNRRFYRQGLNWAVGGFRLHTNGTTVGTVNLYKIQSTWMASNAWMKSYALWNQMNDQVLDNQPTIKPRYHDFKIHMDSDHISNTFGNNLIPYNEDKVGTQTEYVQGEWTRSLIEMPNTDAAGLPSPGDTEAYALKMHGSDTTSSKALIQGYADSRSVPFQNDPATQADADTGWMNLLLDQGQRFDDIAFNLQTIGEDLPYSQLLYPGANGNAEDPSVHAVCNISQTTVGGTTGASGGSFQCGLIKIVSTLLDPVLATAFELELILVPGPHRGYLCEPMQDV
jgi:hypothetical protein